MINARHIDEVEAMIREGRHGKARHLIRDLLTELQGQESSDRYLAEKINVIAGLLSDTLDMLLMFCHESQISLNGLHAARLLAQPQPSVRSPIGAKWRRIKY